ncbi:interleukin-1 receptor type 2-like [Conger conger]|uniref:interleukin-1 receptor type 2-like n=1 Tax=Conger conger TaxID=82655 RepID=UPI002A5AC568|nr:interleukin-1 receptor type 2-like [Conger conger]
MQRIHTSSGPLSLGPVLTMALVCSCCFLVSETTADDPSPKILRPKSVKIKASLGKPLVIPCKADAGFGDDVTLVYWLVNRSFVELAYPDGRIRMDQEETDTKGNKTFIQRDLEFRHVTRDDFGATYICVVRNVMGIDRKELRLKRVNQNCMKGRKWKESGEKLRKKNG